ncbi:HAD-IIB family hydrolase [Paracoccus sphaerophysae]|uniref:HAD-IIB family hydrolase n=2 Tax=Pseudomonadota TaxID=1224 RepID=UPI0006895C8A|nr:HAD-IIB family hydrolase [Paracoccus sphaerophysae]
MREAVTRVGEGLAIRRFAGHVSGYLCKESLCAEVPALTEAMARWIAVEARRPDVIHAHFSDAAAIAFALRERFGIPVIYTPHSLGADKGAPAGAALRARLADESRALAEADAIVVSSRDEAERQVGLYDGAALGRVHQVRPGVALGCDQRDLTAGRALLAGALRDPGRPFVLAIARPVDKKNLVALAAAYAGSRALQERANLVILAGQRGPGWGCPEQRAQIAQIETALTGLTGQAGRVALPAVHDRAQVRGLYTLAAAQGGVFVNPALVEPFGLTTLEAAAAGLPCVVPQRGGAAEVAEAIGHGVAAETRDPAALAEVIGALLDPAAHARHAAAARRAAPGLGWDSYAARLARVIRALRAPVRARAARTLLVCDIDGTLTGDRAAARRFRDRIEADPSLAFAVATGRSVSEARRILADWDLPEPEALITSAGSEIYRRDPAGRMVEDHDYTCRSRDGFDPKAITAALDGLPGLHWQAAIEQRAGKLGFVGPPALAAAIRARLAAAGLPATVVHSHGTLIDVMAAGADKGHAVAWLAARLGFDDDAVIVAGDSGNDLAMLDGRWRAVLVGDDPDLRSLRPGPRRHRARAAHAAGVLEGLAYFEAGVRDSAA